MNEWTEVKHITCLTPQYRTGDLSLQLKRRGEQGRVFSFGVKIYEGKYSAAVKTFNRRVKDWHERNNKSLDTSLLVR
jgi:hypothetical protein